MNNKPLPLFPGPVRAICDYCGQTSYSAAGVHPQCVVRAADQEWTKRMKARREASAEAAPKAVQMYQRVCPRCEAIQHVRAKKCTCGHIFPIKSRTATSK